ncbi:MAG: hypothetical protein M1812_004611 [Candelaria pacifica]|nr:MAG: hypothetical protein M1812_004611 [Candelaria pacifica]
MPNHAQNLARQAESAAQDTFLADRTLIPQTIFNLITGGTKGHRVARMATAAINSLNTTIANLTNNVTNLTNTNTHLRTLNTSLVSKINAAKTTSNAIYMGFVQISIYIPKTYKLLYNCDDVVYPNGNQYVPVGSIDGTHPLASEVPTHVAHVPVAKRGKGYGLHRTMRDAKAIGEYVEDLRGAKKDLIKQLELLLPSLTGANKSSTEELLASMTAKFDAQEEYLASEEGKMAGLSEHDSDEEDDEGVRV